MGKEIFVTQPYLPPLEEVIQRVKGIYERNILTNGGPEEAELERRLMDLTGVRHFFFVSNGTVALQIALRATGITGGEIITTPFTYVATTSAILWERCVPVFVDIDPVTLNMDPDKLEDAITPDTKAIMPVHVFGHPCDMDRIEEIAAAHALPVIYDAAHAFGVSLNGRQICARGHISTLSFHATKLFHTLEGGGCATNDEETAVRLRWIKRFGHCQDNHMMPGINAKQDEVNAAFGNLNLNHLDEIRNGRRRVWELYERALGAKYRLRKIDDGVEYNYAYFPVIFKSEAELLAAFDKLAALDIYPRRYFYPSLTRLPYVHEPNACPIAEDISIRIACLPLFAGLDDSVVERICEVLLCE